MPLDSVAIIGAGVIGLTTAVVAQAAGYQVTIYTDRLTSETTSAKAAASFKPTSVPYDNLTHRLVETSWLDFDRIVSDYPETSGVRKHIHWEAASDSFEHPPYLAVMEDAAAVERPIVPGGYAFAWRYRTFFVDTTLFLPWLVQRFLDNGGSLNRMERSIASLDEITALPQDLIFNCAGLGARWLCHDDDIIPVKGQVALIGPVDGMDWSIKADGFYVYPRRHDTVLGGTEEWNVEGEIPESGAIDAIVRANRRILPHLQLNDIRRVVAGARPCRPSGVRLELQRKDGMALVHNYGHGGAGITLSWGSARLALELVT